MDRARDDAGEPTETHEEYVRRHCLDHNLGEFASFEDAERNLGVWCGFYLERYIIGNVSLGTRRSPGFVADYEPCWEDWEYLWGSSTFSIADTEQEIDPLSNLRTYRLKPYAERDHANAVYKRFKKLTKVRNTQKTSKCKALLTITHLHGYFVLGRRNIRVLAISSTNDMARKNYLTPLAQLWKKNANLRRLYGTSTYTRKHKALLAAKEVNPELVQAEVRDIALLGYGAQPKDTLLLRWLLDDDTTSGQTALSLAIAGISTTTAGSRWDLILVDDPVSEINSRTKGQREKVAEKIAELRKQGDADSEIVYLNTPRKIDDASAQIDNEQGDQYHIIYRPARWEDDAGEIHHYWQYNAAPPGPPPEPGKFPRNAVWPVAKVIAEEGMSDFYSQILLRPHDPRSSPFTEADFPIVELSSCAPEIRLGLGGTPIPDIEQQDLSDAGLVIRPITLVDPSGNDQKTDTGDDTFIVSGRFDRHGNFVILQMAAGQFNATEEKNAVWDAWVYVGGGPVEYETAGSAGKWVKNGYADFFAEKSQQLKRSVAVPMYYRDAATTKNKHIRGREMEPFIKARKLLIASSVPLPLRKKFIGQWTGQEPHDDGKDAASKLLYYIEVRDGYRPAAGTLAASEEPRMDEEGNFLVPNGWVLEFIKQPLKETRGWGQGG